MRKFLILLSLLAVLSCDSEDSGDCFQKAGKMITEEVTVSDFHEIQVYDKIKLYIEQGSEEKVVIETGKNLLNEITVEVVDGRLILKNENVCNLFRDYGITKIYVTFKDLDYLEHAGNIPLESVGKITLDDLWLVSENQAQDPEIHTVGDFILDLEVQNLRITNDNYSNYFLTGSANSVNAFFAAGDGRLEGRDFIVQNYEIFHRGTNKLIVNPQQSLKGDIYSYGDVISVNRPPQVNMEEHFKGRLIFDLN